MTPDDLYELTGVSDPRVSPDGTRVAYVVTTLDREANKGSGAIWIATTDGSAPPRRLTAGTAMDAAPRWSPDGTRIAFASTREGDHAQLWVIPVDGGEAAQVAALEESIGEPAWSPDGTRIAFSARVPDPAYAETDERKRAPRRFTRLQFKLDNEGWTGDRRKHLFVVAADGSAEPVQITDGDVEDANPAWSPDGAQIAFTSARDEDWDRRDLVDLYVVASDGGEPVKLTTGDGSSASPAWSPDGARLAYLYTPGVMDWPFHTRIAVLDVATRTRTLLTDALDRNCSPYPPLREPAWDGDRILFGVEDGGNTHLYAVGADGTEKPDAVITGERTVTGFDVAGGVIAHTISTPTSLPELHLGETQVTDVGAAFATGRALAAPERFTAVSADGTPVDAWIMHPHDLADGARVPVILSIHGGPYTQYGNRFFDEFQVYTGAGYAVVFANPRGSSGYSEASARAIRGPGDAGPGMGSVDYEDLMAVMDEALARFPFCDPDRTAVMGGSYGGYMTSWIIGHTDRFTTAISERAVNSWTTMWGSSDIGWAFTGYVGKPIYEDPAAWRTMSPLEYAPSIDTPVLILHSENDLRCNIEQGEQLFTTLRLLGKPVEMVRFPGESHELSRSGSPAHRVMRFEVILEWLARYLG